MRHPFYTFPEIVDLRSSQVRTPGRVKWTLSKNVIVSLGTSDHITCGRMTQTCGTNLFGAVGMVEAVPHPTFATWTREAHVECTCHVRLHNQSVYRESPQSRSAHSDGVEFQLVVHDLHFRINYLIQAREALVQPVHLDTHTHIN